MFQWGEFEKVIAVVSQLLHRVKEMGFDAEGGEQQLAGFVQFLGL